MKIGILGGTFDPVHNGHLKVAEEVKKRLGLEKVIFLPAGRPWMKADRAVTPAKHRVAMVRRAITGRPGFALSLAEVNRPGATYTVETIRDFRKQFGEQAEIFFVIGWDSLAQLPRWKEASLLVKLCRIVAVPRPGFAVPDLKELERKIPGLAGSIVLLGKPLVDVSAIEIRKRAARGLSLKRMVPAPVAEYIKEHGLYI